MNNEIKFKYSRLDKHPYNGVDVHIVLIDDQQEDELDHGDKSEEVVHTVSEYTSLGRIDGVHTYRINAYSSSVQSRLETVKKLYEQGKCDILSISMHGFSLRTSKTRELYDWLAERVYIIAASGNTGSEQYNYPASDDKCLSVGACDIRSSVGVPHWLGYSTRNDRVDVGQFSNINLIINVNGKKFKVEFGGTSCATPYMAGIVAKLIQWFKEVYNRKPNHKEVNSMIFNFCQKVYVKGELLDTPNVYVGRGIPKLPLRFYPSWCSIHMSYLEEEFDIDKVIYGIRNQYSKAEDFKKDVTRFEQIRLIAKCLGCKQELSPEGYVKYIGNHEDGFKINGKVVNGIETMGFNDPMTRAEEIAFLSKAHSKGKIADLSHPNYEWILSYLKDRETALNKLYPSFTVNEVCDIVKDMWYWKYYKYFSENIGELSSFEPTRVAQRSEMIKMTALTYDFE